MYLDLETYLIVSGLHNDAPSSGLTGRSFLLRNSGLVTIKIALWNWGDNLYTSSSG